MKSFVCMGGIAGFVALGAGLPGFAAAQDYPSRQVTMVVPTAPGGSIDLFGRLYASELAKRWKQPVVVENRPGATGQIGAEAVARAQPDGYTLLMTTDATMTQSVFKAIPFDAERDLMPLAIVASTAQICYTPPQTGFKTWQQLVAHAKANPGKLNYVEYPGTTNELYHLRLWKLTGIELTAVPYNAQAAGVQAILTNTAQLFCSTPTGIGEHAKAGRVVLLAVTSREPNAAFPGVPTIRSTGLDYEWRLWFGMMAPAGTPAAIVARIQRDVADVQASSEVQATVAKVGLDPETRSPKETAAIISATGRQFKELAREFGIKPKQQ